MAAIAALDRKLSGRLPCVVCGYDLRGLSVLAVCPECGSLVRATILAAVDPLADELKPIERPFVVAAGLVAWSVGGLMAALLAWAGWVILLLQSGAGSPVDPTQWRLLSFAVAGALVVAGVGALGLRRPHAGLGWLAKGQVVAGALGYVPAAWLAMTVMELARQRALIDPTDFWSPAPERSGWRLLLAINVGLIILALRPHIRLLVARSLVIRSGRVDRQTLIAMASVLVIGMAADGVGLAGSMVGGGMGDTLRMIAMVLMVSTAAMMTLGLAGAVADSVRIARAVVTPARSLRAVLEPAEGEFGRRGGDRPTRGGGQ